MKKTSIPRLVSLDILRGITISGMILVNNPGTWSKVYAPLQHAQWNGLTPTDLVFPFFMFIMGISTYISLRKGRFVYGSEIAWKIIKRTAVIFLIGLGIAWFALSFCTWHDLAGESLDAGSRLWQAMTNFEHIRIMGVMQRLALCYCATAIIALVVKHKYIPYVVLLLLGGYFLVLLLGKGFTYDQTNILSVVDRAVLGEQHMYNDNGIDPEGLLSTIPAIAHVLIGFCCGKLLMEVRDVHEKMLRLFLVGTVLTFAGFLLNYGCSVNKKIWSPSYVLVTCGLASNLLALLIWIIDVKEYKTWSQFFRVFGVNPLFIYVMGAALSILLGNIYVTVSGQTMSIQGYVYGQLLQPVLGDYPASLAYAILFIVICWAVGYVLYKRNIYIKI